MIENEPKPGLDKGQVLNPAPAFAEAFRFWLKLGFVSFGGPAGQIAIMHAELVEKRRWMEEGHFLRALNFCMLLPGPEATQLAIYSGWLLHGWRGGVVAGVLFVLPAALLLWGLSWVYVAFGKLWWIEAMFYGLKPAVVAIVAVALIRMGRKSLKTPVLAALALLAFVALYFLHAPFPLIIVLAGVVGWISGVSGGISAEKGSTSPNVPGDSSSGQAAPLPPIRRAGFGHALKVAGICLVLWWTPVLALWVALGPDHVLVQQGIFFSKAAVVTFGGAYAVLPYVAQQAVERFSWLSAEQMLDGLGLAETTPGPLIIVLQFAGFLGGWNHPGPLVPLAAATLGAFITTWTTFVPCFLWILAGAPHVERWGAHRRWNSALTAITAAVVGVILNLAIWFAREVVFDQAERLDEFALVVALAGLLGMLKWKWNLAWVIVVSALLGLIFRAAGL